jgi:hypothetical protein
MWCNQKEQPGYYNGRHYSTYVSEIENLKKQGFIDQAEHLLLELVNATEAEAKANNSGVAPWYYEELAKIYRRRKDYQKEVAIRKICQAKTRTRCKASPIIGTSRQSKAVVGFPFVKAVSELRSNSYGTLFISTRRHNKRFQPTASLACARFAAAEARAVGRRWNEL